MKSCEVIVNFDVDNFDIIKSKLGVKDVTFLTNDLMILDKGKELGLDIELLGTYFGFFTPEDDSINNISIDRLNFLENNLNDGTLERASLVYGLRYVNLLNLSNLERIRKILEIKENVVFLFHNFAFYYQAILDIAKITGHKTRYNISVISNSEITPLDPSERWYRFETLKKRLRTKVKEKRQDSFTLRLSKIKLKQKNSKIGFFLINNDTDFYLKPIYPIIKKLNNDHLSSVSFTFDERTASQMSEKKFKSTSLRDYFLQAVFPYSISLKDQFKYIFGEQEKRLSSSATAYYYAHLQKYQVVQKLVYTLKPKSIFAKKFSKIGKLFIVPIVVFDLILIQLTKRYILAKWAALRFYVRNLEKYQFIRNIVTKPSIKSILVNDLTGLEEEIPFLDFRTDSIPSLEINKILKFVSEAKMIKSDDIIIRYYLKYFHDNYVVNLLVKLLIIHAVIDNILKNIPFQSLMIAADSPPFNNVVCNIANNNKIPTYSIPQVFIKFPKISIMLPNASKILVSGERVKNEFVRFGMKEEKIIVTGNPRYDYMGQHPKEFKQKDVKSSKKICSSCDVEMA